MNREIYLSNERISLAEYINDADARMYDIKREHHSKKQDEA